MVSRLLTPDYVVTPTYRTAFFTMGYLSSLYSTQLNAERMLFVIEWLTVSLSAAVCDLIRYASRAISLMLLIEIDVSIEHRKHERGGVSLEIETHLRLGVHDWGSPLSISPMRVDWYVALLVSPAGRGLLRNRRQCW